MDSRPIVLVVEDEPLIGLTVELWTWIFPGAVELKNTGALITLIVVLLVRPQGLLGRKERIG